MKITENIVAFPESWPDEYLRFAKSHPEGEALILASSKSADEFAPDPEALPDPTGEASCSPIPFVHRKHSGKALILLTSKCFSYCRFCFRRATPPGGARELSSGDLLKIRDWLLKEFDVNEVILSGGDPLTLEDDRLSEVLKLLGEPAHIKKLRVHSRAPIVKPGRINKNLIEIFCKAAKPVSMITHVVHPAEFREELWRAMELLSEGGIPLFNQTVMLKGINADPDILSLLISELHARGIETKYIHHTDRAPGNAKFRVSIREGLSIYSKLQDMVESPPEYVIDLPNGAGKFPVSSLSMREERYTLKGLRRRYRWEGPPHKDSTSAANPPFEWWDITEQG